MNLYYFATAVVFQYPHRVPTFFLLEKEAFLSRFRITWRFQLRFRTECSSTVSRGDFGYDFVGATARLKPCARSRDYFQIETSQLRVLRGCWASKSKSGTTHRVIQQLTFQWFADMDMWDRGLPREGVGAEKFGMSLETREVKLLWRDIPGFCRHRLKMNSHGLFPCQISFLCNARATLARRADSFRQSHDANYSGQFGEASGSVWEILCASNTPGLLLSSHGGRTSSEVAENFRGSSGNFREVRGLPRSSGEPDSLPATRQICLHQMWVWPQVRRRTTTRDRNPPNPVHRLPYSSLSIADYFLKHCNKETGGEGREGGRVGPGERREGLWLEGRIASSGLGGGGAPSKGQLGPDPHLGPLNIR